MRMSFVESGCCILVALIAALGSASAAEGAPRATLTLDQLSFVSSSDGSILEVPAGGTIGLRFSEASGGDIWRFVVRPEDVRLEPARSADGSETIDYSLAGPASGVMRTTDSGASVVLEATISAKANDGQAVSYTIRFTTERTTSVARSGESVVVSGMRVVPNARYVQLVGATANSGNDGSRPIHVVLSGTFDVLPF